MNKLTQERIENMTSDEVDAFIMAHVAKWAWFGDCWCDRSGYSRPSGFSPSTNIAAAKEIQEIWLNDHPDYAVSIEVGNVTSGRIYDAIFWREDGEKVLLGTADTEALAICRAVLMEFVGE